MGRPKQQYGLRRNGNSLQLFLWGKYIGSESLALLCEKKLLELQKHTGLQSTQESREQFEAEKESFHTESQR